MLAWLPGRGAFAQRPPRLAENELHWTLVVVFGEDLSRVRTRNAAYNFSILRRLSMNLLRQHPIGTMSLRQRRTAANWDPE